jgi:ferric-dicitrate binding protein FerR (iron transport regulator)
MHQYCHLLVLVACLTAVSPVAAQAAASPLTHATAVAALSESPRIGTFKEVRMPVWIGQADKRKEAVAGEAVTMGERLSTGSSGSASLTLKDGTVLSLGPNTTLDLNQFQFNTTTQEGSFGLNLIQGTLRVITGLLAKVNPERFRITTPTAVVGVRGTDFIVEAERATGGRAQGGKRPERRRHPTR